MDREVTYQGADLEALATLNRYQSWIVDTFQPYLSGRAVEFGAGIGNISMRIRSHVSSLDLVEPSANLIPPLVRRFEGDGAVAVFRERLEAHLPKIDDETYDTVILVNVLEHIEDDTQALENLRRVLKPGGHLLLFVPALKFLYSDLDALVGHYRRYQRPSLNEKVTDAGLQVVRSQYFDTLGVFPWWLLNTMMGATAFNPFLVGVYDAVFAPASRMLESLVAPPFGKNIILVARH
jgi:SAM-dependent methyltransferase